MTDPVPGSQCERHRLRDPLIHRDTQRGDLACYFPRLRPVSQAEGAGAEGGGGGTGEQRRGEGATQEEEETR